MVENRYLYPKDIREILFSMVTKGEYLTDVGPSEEDLVRALQTLGTENRDVVLTLLEWLAPGSGDKNAEIMGGNKRVR